jgi:hypothetical protein
MAIPSQMTADDQPAMKPALGHEPADSCPAIDYSDFRAPSIAVLDKDRKPLVLRSSRRRKRPSAIRNGSEDQSELHAQLQVCAVLRFHQAAPASAAILGPRHSAG